MKSGALYLGERCLLPRVWKTTTAMDRMRGLLARPPLKEDEGLLIEPCGSVHTVGMRYSLDLMFLGRDWKIKKIVHGLAPLRLSVGFGAFRTLETAAGVLAGMALRKGDVLVWREAS